MPGSTISQATAAARRKPGESGRHITFCRFCEAFCGLTVDVAEGRRVKIAPDRDNPHSHGQVCIKGTSALDLVYDPDRVPEPLRRVGGLGEFEPVGWDEAMDDIAGRLAAIIRHGGPDAAANYSGNPTAYSNGAQVWIRPFLAHFGIWKMFSAATQDVTARMMASYIAYGSGLVLADTLTCTNSLSKVVTDDGLVHLWHPLLGAEVERLRATPPPGSDERRLFSIRTLKSMNSWLHNVDKLARSQHPALSIHPADAAKRGIADGGRARVATPSGSVEVDVRITESVARGAVCYPHGWGHTGGNWRGANAIQGANINLLADPRAGDAISASSMVDGFVVTAASSEPRCRPNSRQGWRKRTCAAPGHSNRPDPARQERRGFRPRWK